MGNSLHIVFSLHLYIIITCTAMQGDGPAPHDESIGSVHAAENLRTILSALGGFGAKQFLLGQEGGPTRSRTARSFFPRFFHT
jgi:hypothetical protein